MITSATIGGIYSNEEEMGFRISWWGSNGFGQIGIRKFIHSGVINIDSETMSREFVKEVFAKLVDDAQYCE